ncbi:MAG: prepilin-type N-terminal cleavage/methylation domain-containing protein [Armatimonadetes bacterium]|nr:prepilin-type N-terminal cleavage/methylation domain-containing protein [Armatimonadota bacterium]
MHRRQSVRAFTLIELLTVIAIIAVLAAILFPMVGSLQEQARASSCMSQLHQVYVAAMVYREDEGGFPPALLGYVEVQDAGAGCTADPTMPRGIPYGGSGSPSPVGRVSNGFLYPEQVKAASTFTCPDIPVTERDKITVAYFPNTQTGDPLAAGYWDRSWIGDSLKAKGCPSDAAGTVDCFWDIDPNDPCLGHLHMQPRYFYVSDAFDVSPRVGSDGKSVRDANGQIIYDRHYSPDWTGVRGATDWVNQLKYSAPPTATTLLTLCTWHTAGARSDSATAINLAGTAKKISIRDAMSKGPAVFVGSDG